LANKSVDNSRLGLGDLRFTPSGAGIQGSKGASSAKSSSTSKKSEQREGVRDSFPDFSNLNGEDEVAQLASWAGIQAER
jgi:hypothetical protein